MIRSLQRILTVGLIVVFIILGIKAIQFFTKLAKTEKIESQPSSLSTLPDKLPGMPAYLEPELQKARERGAEGLRRFLREHYFEIKDPRLAEIELDYVVLVGLTDREEARRVLERIGKRITPESPVYKRYRALLKNYYPEKATSE